MGLKIATRACHDWMTKGQPPATGIIYPTDIIGKSSAAAASYAWKVAHHRLANRITSDHDHPLDVNRLLVGCDDPVMPSPSLAVVCCDRRERWWVTPPAPNIA